CAPAVDRNSVFTMVIQAIVWQWLHNRQLFLQSLTPVLIPRSEDVPGKLVVLGPAQEVSTASQQQSLVDSLLDSVVGLLHVSILMRVSGVVLRRYHPVVAHQRLVVRAKFLAILAAEGGGTEIVGPVRGRYPPKRPQCVLQP